MLQFTITKSLSWRIGLMGRRIWYMGWQRYCPICCGYFRKFQKFGNPSRPEAKCPGCNTLERHRLVWRYFQVATDLFDSRPKKMLHVAPESFMAPQLKKFIGKGYLTADLLAPNVMEKMDLTDIQHPDNSFDVIYCSHVLEHIVDDRKAISEVYRVLSNDGWAILLVPVTCEKTIESKTFTENPEDRLLLFGQEDHWRRYGPDYKDRLTNAGFKVEALEANNFLDSSEIKKIRVDTKAAGNIFYCTK